MMKGNMMQTYIDLIQRRKTLQGDAFNSRQLKPIVETLQQSGIIPKDATDLDILKALCEVLYAVHYLAGANDLPLDDAYSKMLMHNTVIKESGEPIEFIFRQYRERKLIKAASPIHALLQRIQDIENIKDKEILSLKEQRAALAKRLTDNGFELE